MCPNPLWFGKESSLGYSLGRFVQRLDSLSRSELGGGLHISGGEPTLHPHFFSILHSIKRKFPTVKLYLLTNGRMFAYEDFTQRVLMFDNLYLQISIFGHNARLHDRITGVRGSFEQTVSGIENILSGKQKNQFVEIRVVLVKQNLKALHRIVKLVTTRFRTMDTFVVIFPEPEGRCAVNFKDVGIKYSQAKKPVSDLVRSWKGVPRDLRLYHFPLCTLEPSQWKFAWLTQYPGETEYIGTCRNCAVRKYCTGIHKNYLPIVGNREFNARGSDVAVKLHRGIRKKYNPIAGLR
jgi:sulfatase maturation enzyme AslB (radical SAM superfamily)